jgi:hypothetical protein
MHMQPGLCSFAPEELIGKLYETFPQDPRSILQEAFDADAPKSAADTLNREDTQTRKNNPDESDLFTLLLLSF